MGRYDALAGQVGHFVLSPEPEFLPEESDFHAAELVATVTASDVDLDIRLPGRDTYLNPANEKISISRYSTIAMRWLWGLQVQYLDPKAYGLTLQRIPWVLRHDGRPLDADSLPRGQDPHWLRPAQEAVAWMSADADPEDPLTPMMQPRVSRVNVDVEWVVLQVSVDANDAQSDGVMAFAWDDAEGMAAAAQLLLTSGIEEVNALRALAAPEQWVAYRQRAAAYREVERVYEALRPRAKRTLVSANERVARRLGCAPPYGVCLKAPTLSESSANSTRVGRYIAAEWRGSKRILTFDRESMQRFAEVCRDVDPQLAIVRVSEPGAHERVYTTRTPELFAQLRAAIQVSALALGGLAYALRERSGAFQMDIWAGADGWKSISSSDC
jgi:hypothetical protein